MSGVKNNADNFTKNLYGTKSRECQKGISKGKSKDEEESRPRENRLQNIPGTDY